MVTNPQILNLLLAAVQGELTGPALDAIEEAGLAWDRSACEHWINTVRTLPTEAHRLVVQSLALANGIVPVSVARQETREGNGLFTDCVDYTPQDFDFSEGFGERWDIHPSCRQVACAACEGTGQVTCEDCNVEGQVSCSVCDGSGMDKTAKPCWNCDDESGMVDCDLCGGSQQVDCNTCDGTGRIDDDDDPDAGHPMMNYLYPLGSTEIPHNVGTILEGLPLTVVQVEEGHYYLALTGGGMDLSWEICTGYVRLGYYPPAHFANLPRMAGRGESDADKRLLAICRESLEIAAIRANGAVEEFNRKWS